MLKKLFSSIFAVSFVIMATFSSCTSGASTSSQSNSTKPESSSVSSTFEPEKLKIATTTADLKGSEGFETDEAVIRGLYQAGFRNIDLGLYGLTQDSVYMQENWEQEVLKLKSVAEELGMKFVQAHSPGGNPLSENPQEVESLIATTIRSIEICEVLGIENTVVHSGWKMELSKKEWFAENKAFYEKLLPTAEECGVNVLCENSTFRNMGGNYYINTGKDMREFIDYVDHPNFHGCWDTGHANCEGVNQYEAILELDEELYAIHFADNMGDADTHLIPYCGTLNIDQVMLGLIDVEFEGYFTLECDGGKRTQSLYKGPEFDWIKPIKPNYPVTRIPQHMTRMQQETLLYQVAEYILNSYNMLDITCS